MKKITQKLLAVTLTASMSMGLAGCEFLENIGNNISNYISAEIDEMISSIVDEMGGSIPDGFNPDDYIPDDGDGSVGGSTSGDSTGGGSADGSTSGDSTGGGSADGSTSGDSTGGGSADGSTSSDSTGDGSADGSTDTEQGGNTPEIPDDEQKPQIDFHFLELGNKYAGDSTYIKAGDVDILIDAGSRKDSATTIANYVNQYCEDGVLEYVIATHAHQDHIAGFVGNGNQGIFDLFKVGTLIDFSRSNSTSQIYSNYKTKRASIIEKYGTKHYTVLEWWKEEKGLTRSIELADGITMNVLYQKYYETKGDENDYSVCVMFSQGENHYLFTGDLEKSGEESLVASNNLPKMKLYKAGHHGSKTSSNTVLMQKIQPEVVCVCCCAGTDEYTTNKLNQFPTQDFINRVAPYTDKIYVTSLVATNSNGFTSMNGNIVVSSKGGEVTVNCSNNNTILKETAWFKANRTWPSNGK